MTTTNPEIRNIYQQRHDNIVRRDLQGLMKLYAENAAFESWPERRLLPWRIISSMLWRHSLSLTRRAYFN
jgi:hypothetical protein